ncbi:C25 family cysteine peptidase [candidate division KSB1 bacterium]
MNAEDKYLIITMSLFTSTLEPFIEMKEQQGFTVVIREKSTQWTIAEVVSKIDSFKTNLKYILLVGNHETHVPTANVEVGGITEYGDYLYGDASYKAYVDLEFDPEWDVPGFPNFGANYAVGRFPATNTTELTNIINKTIKYESHPPDGDWTDKALMIAGIGTVGEYIANIVQVTGYSNYNVNISPDFTTLNGGTAGVDNSDITQSINSGFGIVAYRDHGYPGYWGSDDDGWNETGDKYNTTLARNLSNGDKTSVIFSIACYTGAISSSSESLGEAFVRANDGAVAFYGSSKANLASYNDYLNIDIFKELYDEGNITIGDATNIAAGKLLTYPDSIFRWEIEGEDSTRFLDSEDTNGLKRKRLMASYSWFGDPSLNIWVESIPTKPEASNFKVDGVTSNSVKLTWTNPGSPAEGVLVWRKESPFTSDDKPNPFDDQNQTTPTGIYKVYSGTGTNVTDNNLTSGQTYYYKIFSYNKSSYYYSIYYYFYFYSDGVATSGKPYTISSSSTNAIAHNNSRKIVRDSNGDYHLVWIDNGDVYYTRTNGNFTSWLPKETVYTAGTNAFPGITLNGGDPVITFTYNSTTVKFAEKSGSSWSVMTVGSCKSNEPAAIASDDGDESFVAYVDASNNVKVECRDNSFATSTTVTSSGTPTDHNIYWGHGILYFVWLDGSSIKYRKATYSSGTYTFDSIETVRTQSGIDNPSLTGNSIYNVRVSWTIAGDGENGERVGHRRRTSQGWGTVDELDFDSGGAAAIGLTSITAETSSSKSWIALEANYGFGVGKTSTTMGYIYTVETDGSGDFDDECTANEEGEGYYPSFSQGRNDAQLIWRSDTGTPYEIEHHSTEFSKTNTSLSVVNKYRTMESDVVRTIKGVPVTLGKLYITMGDAYVESLNDQSKLTFVQLDTLKTPRELFRFKPAVIGFQDQKLNLLYKVKFVPENREALALLPSKGAVGNIVLKDNTTGSALRTLSVLSASALKNLQSDYNEEGTLSIDLSGVSGKNVTLTADIPDTENDVLVQRLVFGKGLKKDGIAAFSVNAFDSPVRVPEKTELRGNYPNPFNPVTTIHFSLHESVFVGIDVYNILGQKVATLLSDSYPAGTHQVQWNGRNDMGSPVSGGVYLVKMAAGNTVQTRKIILLK